MLDPHVDEFRSQLLTSMEKQGGSSNWKPVAAMCSFVVHRCIQMSMPLCHTKTPKPTIETLSQNFAQFIATVLRPPLFDKTRILCVIDCIHLYFEFEQQTVRNVSAPQGSLFLSQEEIRKETARSVQGVVPTVLDINPTAFKAANLDLPQIVLDLYSSSLEVSHTELMPQEALISFSTIRC